MKEGQTPSIRSKCADVGGATSRYSDRHLTWVRQADAGLDHALHHKVSTSILTVLSPVIDISVHAGS